MNRREFLEGAAALGLLSSLARAQDKPVRKYRTALLGSGWWGMNILREAIASGASKVAALCDVDPKAVNSSADEVKRLTGDEPARYSDFRELLEKEKPEIAIVAAPDHWHSLLTLAALKAGAHVFVEKPTGHTILESRAMLKAARDADRVVQVGLHRRIGPHHVSGMKFLKEGRAGKISSVRMFVLGGAGPERPTANGAPPKGMDWDLYCGPAPLRPFNSRIHPGGFRNFLDFANGLLGDWGVHWIDQMLWWSEEKYPKRIFSSGGRKVKGDPVLTEKEQTTDSPDTQIAVFEFSSFSAFWEHRPSMGNELDKHRVGAYFHGTQGVFHMGWRDGWTFYPSNAKDKPIHENSQLQEPDGHNIKLLWADFLESISAGRRPVADIELAHRSTTTILLGMLSLKLGRSVAWDGEKEQIVGDPAATALMRRDYRSPWKYPEP